MNVSSVWETGVFRMSFHIRYKPGNQSISVVQLGSWRLLNYHVEFVRVTQERLLINGRIRPPYRMNRLFFLCLPFFYFLFMMLYTSSVCVYYILHTFSESPIYMHLYIHYLYVYIYIYIYTFFFLKSKNAFPEKEKATACLWTKGEKRNIKNSIHLRINVMVAAKLTGRKTKQNETKRQDGKVVWKNCTI